MSATLGEILRKVCADIFLDLKLRLGEMKSQDAELRTSVMKLFLSRSKAKLIECYAITKWLSNRNVVNNLQGVSGFQNNIANLENVLNQQMDEFYFSHASIYSMRGRLLEVSSAAEILSSSEYKTLPLSVFSCGIPEIPSLRDSSETVKDLDVYIRTKLLSDKSLASLYLQNISVNGGTLSIIVPNYFSLHLTLQQLNAKSAWSVLGFEVLSIDSPSTPTQATAMNFELLGRSVVNIVSDLCSKEVSVDSGERSVLTRVLSLCRHTSLAASLRLMHRQAMDLAGWVWKGALLVTLDEARQQATCLSLQCWKSQFSREYQIIVNISLANALHASRQSTHTLTTNLTTTSSNSNSNSVAELSLETEAYVREGVRLGDLLSDALMLVVREKIQHLALRLGRSLDDMSQALRQRFKIDVRELSIVVFRDTADVATQTMGLVIEVDVRTGKYLLSSSHAAFGSHLLADCQRDLDLFASEINNVQAEQLFAHHLTRDRSNASASVLLPAESVRTFEAVLRRLALLPWDKRLSALGGRSASVSLTALSRSVSALPSGCLVHCLGEWLSAESELRRAKGTYKAALDPCSREVVKSDSSGASSNKKRKVDQMTGGKGDIKGDLVRAEERMVHLFLLLVVGADLNVTVHAVLRAPLSNLPVTLKQSSQFMEQSICLGSWSHCEEQQQEEEQMCVFLQEAAHSAWLWARTMLINSIGRWKSVDQGGSRGEDQVWLHVPCADGVPIAAVIGSSRRVCVSFLRGGDQQVVDLCLSSGAVGPVSCLEGLVASSAAERLFSGGDAADGVRRSACELRVSLFESSAAGGKFSRQAVLETVSLGPAQTTRDTTSAADGLLTVHEELLRQGLQQVFALSDKSVDWDGLFLLIADMHLLVRLLSHVVRLRAVAAENDDSQSVRVFLRPLSHTARSNSLSFTLAVHRVEDDRSDLLVGYVELALTKPDGLLGTDEGPPATLTVRDLTTDVVSVTPLLSSTVEAMFNCVVYSMCK